MRMVLRNEYIFQRHTNGATFKSIAEEFGLCQQRIRQIFQAEEILQRRHKHHIELARRSRSYESLQVWTPARCEAETVAAYSSDQ